MFQVLIVSRRLSFSMSQNGPLLNCALMLLQISFWLIENGFTVLIAACDTFRAGAVEQLRTHQRRLNSLHPPERHGGRPMVQLYEKGYGKDAAGIAMEAIAYGMLNAVSLRSMQGWQT